MHININDNGTIQAWGIAVKGNLNVNDGILPDDFYDNAFWKYRWNGEGFDSIKALVADDNSIASAGFDIDGPLVPSQDILLAMTEYTYENGEFIHHEL